MRAAPSRKSLHWLRLEKNQDKILISTPAREKTGRSGARTSDAATQSYRSNQAFLIISLVGIY